METQRQKDIRVLTALQDIMPALPDRQAEIAELEAYLRHLKAGEVQK